MPDQPAAARDGRLRGHAARVGAAPPGSHLAILRDAEISAHGLVVETDPVNAVRDALAQDEVDEIVISTHPEQRSGWMRRDVVDSLRKVAGGVPVEHVVVDLEHEEDEANVLVIANETVLGRLFAEAVPRAARTARPPAS